MKSKKTILIGVILLSTLILTSFRGQFNDDDEIVGVETVVIGEQEWTAKNLNVDVFRNGDPIPQIQDIIEWDKAMAKNQPAWCYLKDEVGNKYGKLYNIFAVIDPRGLAPEGFHVSTDEDWTVLTDFLGGLEVAGKKLKSPEGWWTETGFADYPGLTLPQGRQNWIEGGFADNSSGFGALGGAMYSRTFTYTYYDGRHGAWWTSTVKKKTQYWYRSMSYSLVTVNRESSSYGDAMSVRCVKD